jgi:hypothetical protein
MIEIYGPVLSLEYGGCNGCLRDRIEGGSNIPGTKVYEIRISPYETGGGFTLRLCMTCLDEMKQKLRETDAETDNVPQSHH